MKPLFPRQLIKHHVAIIDKNLATLASLVKLGDKTAVNLKYNISQITHLAERVALLSL